MPFGSIGGSHAMLRASTVSDLTAGVLRERDRFGREIDAPRLPVDGARSATRLSLA